MFEVLINDARVEIGGAGGGNLRQQRNGIKTETLSRILIYREDGSEACEWKGRKSVYLIREDITQSSRCRRVDRNRHPRMRSLSSPAPNGTHATGTRRRGVFSQNKGPQVLLVERRRRD